MSEAELFLLNFGILLSMIVIISFIVKFLKQPIILGYVLSGFIFSTFLYTDNMKGQMTIFSEVGITFLLFLMGLEFDFKSLKYLGKDVLFATVFQSLVFFGVGMGVSLLFGFNVIHSIYIALLFMFSSTLFVAKWLEDKKESQTLHGKIVIGSLILQDIIAIIALTIIAVMQEDSAVGLMLIPFKGLILLFIAFIISKYLIKTPIQFASKFPELLFIFSLSICFMFVLLAPILGYTTTIGAFIGGVVLANTIYKMDISARMKPLVIFFNMLFFVGFGFQLDISAEFKLILLAGVLCLLSIILKPFIVFISLKMRGYDNKTSFMSGIYLSNISEFGIIIIASGTIIGAIDKSTEIIGITALLAAMVISSYSIKHSNEIYTFFTPLLVKMDKIFGKKKEISETPAEFPYSIIFFGYYELNNDMIEKLKKQNKNIVVIESDPERIEILKKENYSYIYNSVNNPEFFEHIPFEKVELIISNIVDVNENKMILHEAKKKNPKSVVILAAKSLKDSIELYDHGADYVLFTSYLNNQQVSVLLEDYTSDMSKIISKKFTDHTKLKEIDKKRHDVMTHASIDLNKIFKEDYSNGIRTMKNRVDDIMRKKKIDERKKNAEMKKNDNNDKVDESKKTEETKKPEDIKNTVEQKKAENKNIESDIKLNNNK